MDIIVSADNRKEVLVFPVVPINLNVNIPRQNEEFQTINSGTLNLIGDRGLKTLSISSIFPTHKYSWIKRGSNSNGWAYVNFFNNWANKKMPIRIIITRSLDGMEWINMPCTVESFTYGLTRNEDIQYSLELKEYRFVKVV